MARRREFGKAGFRVPADGAACMKKVRHRGSFPFAFPQPGSRLPPAMQCDFCDSKATVFFTQIIEGVARKSNLCDTCAAGQGVTDPDGFLLGDIPLPPGAQDDAADTPGEKSAARPPMDDKTCCPGCGFAFDDLKKTGRLGCSECYRFFRSEIRHNLAGMHKGTSHSGRVPEGMLEAFQTRQQLEVLEKEMAEAIGAEDYEKAAALRDQISQLQETSLTPDN